MKKVIQLEKGQSVKIGDCFEKIISISKGFWSDSRIIDFKSGKWCCLNNNELVIIK